MLLPLKNTSSRPEWRDCMDKSAFVHALNGGVQEISVVQQQGQCHATGLVLATELKIAGKQGLDKPRALCLICHTFGVFAVPTVAHRHHVKPVQCTGAFQLSAAAGNTIQWGSEYWDSAAVLEWVLSSWLTDSCIHPSVLPDLGVYVCVYGSKEKECQY